MSGKISAPHFFRTPRSVWRRIWNHIQEDDCFDLAAQMSFYFVLALFPFCLILAVVVGWLPSTTLWRSFATWMVAYLPADSRAVVFSTAVGLANGSSGFLSLGVIGSVWSTSSGFVSLMEALSIAYGAKDSRSYFHKHAVATAATVIAAILALAIFGITVVGHWEFESKLIEMMAWDPPPIVWAIGRWTIVLAIMCLAIDLINYIMPSCKRPWRWLTPGTAFVTLTTVIASFGLNLYVQHFSSYPRIYGTLAGFIVLMLWLYIASLILLIGAEADRELEKVAHELSPS
jgi:membrane protein